MKKIFIVSLMLLFVLSSGYSQEVKKVDKYSVMASLGLSGALPMGEADVTVFAAPIQEKDLKFKDLYTFGIGGTIDVAYTFSKNLAGRVEVSFTNFMFDKDAYATRKSLSSDISVEGGSNLLIATKLSFLAGEFCPSKKIGFYGILSLGAYFNMRGDIIEKNNATNYEFTDIRGNNIYPGVGAGFRVMVKVDPKVSLFFEPNYEMFWPSDNWSKARLDQSHQFISAKLGVVVHPF